jgi:hypothetical protein
MKRLTLAASAATFALAMLVAPTAAADFPEQGNPHSCAVLTSLPKDVIAQIRAHAPATADRLEAQLADACS